MGGLENPSKCVHFLCTEYERDLKRTIPEILVDMASWFGVFLGVSITSLVELLYWALRGRGLQ